MAGGKYKQLLLYLFEHGYREGLTEFEFGIDLVRQADRDLGLNIANIPDAIYSLRFRMTSLPGRLYETVQEGYEWTIETTSGGYKFIQKKINRIFPDMSLPVIEIPSSTPGLIAEHAFSDEQALLTVLRYNDLIGLFCEVSAKTVQNHLRTQFNNRQIEIDELYLGIDKQGLRSIHPVQAKGGSDKLSIVQIEQDYDWCSISFPSHICRPVAAQFLEDEIICMYEFSLEASPSSERLVAVKQEIHYRLT